MYVNTIMIRTAVTKPQLTLTHTHTHPGIFLGACKCMYSTNIATVTRSAAARSHSRFFLLSAHTVSDNKLVDHQLIHTKGSYEPSYCCFWMHYVSVTLALISIFTHFLCHSVQQQQVHVASTHYIKYYSVAKDKQ